MSLSVNPKTLLCVKPRRVGSAEFPTPRTNRVSSVPQICTTPAARGPLGTRFQSIYRGHPRGVPAIARYPAAAPNWATSVDSASAEVLAVPQEITSRTRSK